jgi:multidrug efflux pump subunit AcrA (membrane-fusion protein)
MKTLMRVARGSAKYTTCLLIVSLLPGGCKKVDNNETATLVTVQAEKPEIGEISEHIIADATLSPLAQAAIAPKITAPVRKFYVQRGSKVKEGDLLAVLENRDLSAQVVDNKGLLNAAEATYSMQTKAQLPEDYTKAELDLAQAKALLQLQEEIVASRKKLLEEGAIAGRDYDVAAAALVQARAAFDVARNRLNSLQNVSKDATLKQAEGQLASAKGKYQAAEAQVSYSEIHSPISGVVTDRPLFAGETVSSGSTLITVMDTSAMLAKVHLSETVAQRLSVGDEASILVPGITDPVPAKVSLISPALDPGSTTVEVWLRLENKAGRYKAGTPVRASITGRTEPKAIKVPLTAVLTGEDGSKSVMVVDGEGVAHKKAVQLGINDGEDVQITQGLNGSEMVITTGGYGLDDKTKVKVGKPEEEGGEEK